MWAHKPYFHEEPIDLQLGGEVDQDLRHCAELKLECVAMSHTSNTGTGSPNFRKRTGSKEENTSIHVF